MSRQEISDLTPNEIKSFPEAQRDALIKRSNMRWELLIQISRESVCFGLYFINLIYLGLFLFLAFFLFQGLGATVSYWLATVVASLTTIGIAEKYFGDLD